MEVLLLCPQWGQEHLPLEAFLNRVKEAGYDGIDTWVPQKTADRQQLTRLLDKYGLVMVSHQHQATGQSIKPFCNSYTYFLHQSLETGPLLINSHSGRDSFTLDEQLRVIDTAAHFADRNGVQVVHETHRGRIGYSPAAVRDLFAMRSAYQLTADFSHWVCVSESYLAFFQAELTEAIRRTQHIHARVGFTQGPQIPDPRLPEWQEPFGHFLTWWDSIVDMHRQKGSACLTITPEFGPPPYMWSLNGKAVADQWAVNLYMKDKLKLRYSA